MFLYDEKKPFHSTQVKPDPILYEALDNELHGCLGELNQAMLYIRQSFMIHNLTFKEIFLKLGAKRISDMEVLADLLHKLHGEDDRYYDESNDDTPVFEFIPPCAENKKKDIKQDKKSHVNNDLTAAIMENIHYEEEQVARYQKIATVCGKDDTFEVISYLKDSSQESLNILKNALEILTTHTEQKDFGLGDTHNAWDLDTANYFDKPNPYFYNPNDKISNK